MIAKKSTKSVSLNAVMLYTHLGMIDRLQEKLDLDLHAAEELFGDTKKFLYLCATSKDSLAPPPVIDEAWHFFILYTADYSEFCSNYFGRMIHHYPFNRSQVATRDGSAKKLTYFLATEVFGPALSQNWNYQAAAGENCHGCEDCAPIQPS